VIAATTEPLAAARARLDEARATHTAAVAALSTWKIMQAAEALAEAEAAVARLEAEAHAARLGPAREEWERLEADDEADAERLDAKLREHIAPILTRMRERFERRQRLGMRLSVGLRARHAEIFGPSARERWMGLAE